MKRITVLLAEDHTVVREGLRALLEAEGDVVDRASGDPPMTRARGVYEVDPGAGAAVAGLEPDPRPVPGNLSESHDIDQESSGCTGVGVHEGDTVEAADRGFGGHR